MLISTHHGARLISFLAVFLFTDGELSCSLFDNNASRATTAPISECYPSDIEGRKHAMQSDSLPLSTHPSHCTLYLAKSTIPGAGLGIFTGTELRPGDSIGFGDVVIPLIDVWYHLMVSKDYEPDDTYGSGSLDPTAEYSWTGVEIGMALEGTDAHEHATAFAPGLDAATNCHLGVINVGRNHAQYDSSGLHRSRDPGAGAFSPYFNLTTFATKPIPAGGELFKFYGDQWFLERETTIGNIPLQLNYPRAENLIKAFDEKIEQRPGFSVDVRSDVWNLMACLPLPSRTIRVIPKNHSALETVREQGIRGVYEPATIRNLSDLQANGLCIDGLKSGSSTIPQAGHGAFVQRFFPKDSLVTGTPLLFTHTEDMFRMYHGDWLHKETPPDKDKLFGYQLMINYCWRHVSSSFYLCPYGYEVNLINHNQTQANIRMEWARDGFLNHQEHWLTQSPLAMNGKYSPGLIMNFVATKDILPGEELFLDYGDEWERAWQRHVRDFPSKSGASLSSEYVSARDWNRAHATAILRTVDEQNDEPYPHHMEMRCLHQIEEEPDMTSERANELWTFDNIGTECRILERQIDPDNGHVWYSVELAHYEYDEEAERSVIAEWLESDGWIVREAIRLFDRPYTSDLWLDGAFRHPIGIPDDIFPEAWRNFSYN